MYNIFNMLCAEEESGAMYKDLYLPVIFMWLYYLLYKYNIYQIS